MNNIQGKITDDNNEALPFAVVFQSNKDGKPVANAKNTTSDIDGNYSLSNINDTDYITFRMVGLEPKSVLASTATTQNGKKILNVKLSPSAATQLPTVEIVAEKPKPKPEPPKPEPPKPEPPTQSKPKKDKKKNKVGKYLLFGALGLLAVAGVFYAVKQGKKGGKK